MNYFNPQLIGEVGKKQFVLYNGDLTKEFYDVAKFDATTGMYPILNEAGETVEYMDMLGNFSKHTTRFAYHFCKYALSSKDVPFLISSYMKISYTGLVDFPSKYLTDEKIKEIIKKEEKRRFKLVVRKGKFDSLIEMLSYKIYTKQILKTKLHKAELSKKQEVIAEDDIDFEL